MVEIQAKKGRDRRKVDCIVAMYTKEKDRKIKGKWTDR